MRQRLLVARALLNRPRALFLDEPASALDPWSAGELRELVAALAGDGVAIVLVTHDLGEAERLCRRVAVLDAGRVTALGAPRGGPVTARRVRAIAGKDLRDAWRDGRVATCWCSPCWWAGRRRSSTASGAGRRRPARTRPPRSGRSSPALFAVVIVVVFVALMVVPIQTAEELETGTFSALRLAASGPEILAAKALAGYVYAAVAAALTVALTGLPVDDPPQFAAATAALIVTLVGFGLLLGLLVPQRRRAQRLRRVAGAAGARGGRRGVRRRLRDHPDGARRCCRSARR